MKYNCTRFCLAALLSIICGASTFAQDASRQVLVLDATGKATEGKLDSWEKGKLALKTKSDRWDTTNVVQIRWPGQPVNATESDPALLLANGDLLVAAPLKFDERTLTARWTRFSGWPEAGIPLEVVRTVLVQPAESIVQKEQWLDQLIGATDKTDTAWLRNGDSLTGQFVTLGTRGGEQAPGGEATLNIKIAKSERSLPLSSLRAFSFNPELVVMPKRQGEWALLQFVDGSRLHARDLRLTLRDTLAMKTAFQAELDVPLAALSSVQFLGGNVVYLSDMKPQADRSQPYLSLNWPWRADRNVRGGPLRIRNQSFAKGLGVHSHSELVYALDGKFRKFQATVGVDDDAEGKGSVIFRVVVDGRPAWSSPVLTGRAEPLTIEPIDISRAKSLTLIVEFATMGDILDHADWGDARLVR